MDKTLLMRVQAVTRPIPCCRDCTLVQSLWKSIWHHLEKLKVTQKFPSLVETLENVLHVCPCISVLSGVMPLIPQPAGNPRVCWQESRCIECEVIDNGILHKREAS